MNDFNFMIGFDYNSNGLLTPLTEEEQVDFFNKIHEHFDNTDLDSGVNGAWFNEFGPDYCTNCDNCGEKFFLLEKNGDIYSCVRGQKHKEFYYGNIYNNTIEEILNNAYEKIMKAHNMQKMSEECKIVTIYIYVKQDAHLLKIFIILISLILANYKKNYIKKEIMNQLMISL